jgi:voltage-gated potassium channel
MSGSAEALERFERQTAWPMLALSLAIIPLLVIPLVVDLSPSAETTFFALDWTIWAIFAAEYGIRLYLAPSKARFVKGNVIDLFVVIVPFLRPLRVARSARALRLLRASRLTVFLLRALDAGRDVLTHRKLHYTLLISLVVTIGAAVLVMELERGATDANITSLPDALWWAVTTITTVGYGDRFPTTAAGRGVAVVLMIFGIALFGLLAGSLASFFIERGSLDERSELREVLDRLDRIERALIGAGLASLEDRGHGSSPEPSSDEKSDST